MVFLPISGLPIELDKDSGILHLDSSVISDAPQVRSIQESLPYYDHKGVITDNFPLYYMHRNVRFIQDALSLKKSLFRYDITVVLPGHVEQEPFKTIGHVHPISHFSKGSYTYTEVYSVIYGTAHYILQKFSNDFTKILEVVDLEVKAGEHVLIPSFYGHVTVNVTNEPLVMANILYRDFLSNYEPYKENRGASIYLKRIETGEIILKKNEHYQGLPDPIKARSTDFVPPQLLQNQPMYSQWIKNLDGFLYLYQDL